MVKKQDSTLICTRDLGVKDTYRLKVKGDEKIYIACKWKPKEGWGDYPYIEQNWLKKRLQ